MTWGKEMAQSAGPQGFKGKVDCLRLMWADVSLERTEICLLKLEGKFIERKNGNIKSRGKKCAKSQKPQKTHMSWKCYHTDWWRMWYLAS